MATTNSNEKSEGGSLVVGLSIPQPQPDASKFLKIARNDGYDYVTTALPSSNATATIRSDVTSLESKWWKTSVVGIAEDLSNPYSPLQMKAWSEKITNQIEWATHMNIPAVLLPEIPFSPSPPLQPSSSTEANGAVNSASRNMDIISSEYARVVSSVALQASASNGQIWIRTRLTQESLNAFNLLHRQCDGASNVGMMLCLDSSVIPSSTANRPPNSMPANAVAETVANHMVLIHKCIGSQLKAVCFPAETFLTNKRGYPTLSKTHQVLFTQILRRIGRTVRILIEGPSAHIIYSDGTAATQKAASSPIGMGNNATENTFNGKTLNPAMGLTRCLPYLQYIKHIRKRPEIGPNLLDTNESSMEEPYLDHLQRPLQPLADHLEFQTYEIFEKDPVKYAQYRQAIMLALRDGWSTTTDMALHVTIMVVGAGRGPLVTCALEALRGVRLLPQFHDRLPLQARIYAVEKNPSAVVYLQSMVHNSPLWISECKPSDTAGGVPSTEIHVVQADMRELNRSMLGLQTPAVEVDASTGKPRKLKGVVDIVVSELLGSFGDNELSPECLDGLYQTGLLKNTTISIPQQYTSYIAPVSSMRLHCEARSQAYFPTSACDGLDSAPMGTLRALETPYVCRAHAASQTSSEKPCWEFVHPSTTLGSINEREAHVTFDLDTTHGAGYGSGYGPIDPAIASMARATPASSPGPITIHGFLGTFSSELYHSPAGDPPVVISIAPKSFSTSMFSWFPLYFPLREPLHIPSGCVVSVSIWRKSSMTPMSGINTTNQQRDGKVWYEWCAKVVKDMNGIEEVVAMTPIHNPNGRSYQVDM